MCFDGTKRLCHIRGKLRKRQWINAQDIILVGLRDYQDQKADVIMEYNSEEDNAYVDFHDDNESGEEFDVPEQPYQPEISDSSEEDGSDDDLAGI